MPKTDMRRLIITRVITTLGPITLVILALGLFARSMIVRSIRCLPDCVGVNLMDQDCEGWT